MKGTWHINVGVDWWDYKPVAADTVAHHLEHLRRKRLSPKTGRG